MVEPTSIDESAQRGPEQVSRHLQEPSHPLWSSTMHHFWCCCEAGGLCWQIRRTDDRIILNFRIPPDLSNLFCQTHVNMDNTSALTPAIVVTYGLRQFTTSPSMTMRWLWITFGILKNAPPMFRSHEEHCASQTALGREESGTFSTEKGTIARGTSACLMKTNLAHQLLVSLHQERLPVGKKCNSVWHGWSEHCPERTSLNCVIHSSRPISG